MSSGKRVRSVLSLAAQFDDLRRFTEKVTHNLLDGENEMFDIAAELKKCSKLQKSTLAECERLQESITKLQGENRAFRARLQHTKVLLNSELEKKKYLRKKIRFLEKRIIQIRNLVLDDSLNLNEETKGKLALLSSSPIDPTQKYTPRSAAPVDDTISNALSLSEVSFDDTLEEEDSDSAITLQLEHLHREASLDKKEGSSPVARVVQETETPLKEAVADIEATAGNEGDPSRKKARYSLRRSGVGLRLHVYHTTTFTHTEVCIPCGGRINNNELAVKCEECKAICHSECLPEMPMPCIPLPVTNKEKGTVTNFSPQISPMIPSFILHTLTEIESRLHEKVLYRFPPKNEEVKRYLELSSKGNIVPIIKKFDADVLCGAVKAVLETLSDPVITRASSPDFFRAVELVTLEDSLQSCRQLVCDLPQPNREILAYLILHLKKLLRAEKQNLDMKAAVQIFRPLLFGQQRPCEVGGDTKMTQSTKTQHKVIQLLLTIQTGFWTEILGGRKGEIKTQHIEGEKPANLQKVVDSERNDRNVSPNAIPLYETIEIPAYHFKYAVDVEKEDSLNEYIKDLTDDDGVPFMLTEYINDEEVKHRVREHFRPTNVPFYVRQQILEKQPQFSSYFNGL